KSSDGKARNSIVDNRNGGIDDDRGMTETDPSMKIPEENTPEKKKS
ncbi:8359_t:CDS:1, partial [Ambispora gerdemannii]